MYVSMIIGISCWNPAFDVTPAELITGIITERGVFSPHKLCCELLFTYLYYCIYCYNSNVYYPLRLRNILSKMRFFYKQTSLPVSGTCSYHQVVLFEVIYSQE